MAVGDEHYSGEWHAGSGAPADTLGIDGDFYLDTTAQTRYGPKAGGAWGSGTPLVTADSDTTLTNKTLTDPKVTFVTFDEGSISSGTLAVDPTNGSLQKYSNDGAHTLGVPTVDCSIRVLMTNSSSAGAVTTTGYTIIGGSDTLTTTDADRFMLDITRIDAQGFLFIKALQ